MKLYYSKGACSLAVRIVLHELNINAEFESVDLKTKKTEPGADYLKINPKGSVPALMLDNKEILTENAVIQQYLADTHKAHNLLPSIGDFKRYRVLEWLNYVTTEMHKGVGILFNPTLSQEAKDKTFIPLINHKLHYLDEHFANNQYLLGKQFTLPDAYLFVILNWLQFFSIDINQWPQLTRYFTELKNRPSIQQSLKEEGLVK
jgi:glutathione S-transferase